MFASRGIVEHIARGAAGFGGIAAAIALGQHHPGIAFALVGASMLALRGCPMCWTIGLVQTVVARLQGQAAPDACIDGACARQGSRVSPWRSFRSHCTKEPDAASPTAPASSSQ